MSDTAFVPGQVQAADTEPYVDEQQEGKSRRGLALLGAGALVLVLGMVAWLLFFSGGDDATAPKAPKAAAPVAAGVQPSAAPSVAAPKAPTTVARSKHDFRDPFKALIAPAAVSDGTSAAGTTTGSTGTTAGSAGTSPTTSGTTSGTSTSSGGTTVPNPSVAHRLRVVSVSSDHKSITIKVDGKTYKDLKAGEVFAEFFKVIGISGAVNVIQFGDEQFNIAGNDPVTLAG
jgi:hypothetical protein